MKSKNIAYLGVGLTIGLFGIWLGLKFQLSKFKLIQNLNREWAFFGKQTYDINGKKIKDGKKETEKEQSDRINLYWNKGVGLDHSGTDIGIPWSASFISYIMKISGAENNFKYNSSHSYYIEQARKNREIPNAKFVLQKIDNYAPRIGDIICYSRQSGINFYTPAPYASHCDIVVGVRPNAVDVIGGNVGNSVSKRTFKLNGKGLLSDSRYPFFAIIQNKL